MNTATEIRMKSDAAWRQIIAPLQAAIQRDLDRMADRIAYWACHDLPRVNADAEVWEQYSQGGV